MPLPASGQRIGKTRNGRSWEKASVAPVGRRMLFQATGINSAAAADEDGAAAVIAQNRVQARLVALCDDPQPRRGARVDDAHPVHLVP